VFAMRRLTASRWRAISSAFRYSSVFSAAIAMTQDLSARTHLPDIDAVRAVSAPDIRFYAIVGACVSLVSTVERSLFDCYAIASGKSDADCAAEFYKYVRYEHKRCVVDLAIRSNCSDPSILRRWDNLLNVVDNLLGPNGARNLVAHNVVDLRLTLFFSEPSFEDLATEFEFSTSQNNLLVLLKRRAARTEDFESLAEYATRLKGLKLSLVRFSSRLRKACGRCPS
jgi:hypothetical protein